MRIRVTGKHPVKGVKPKREGDVALSSEQARRLVDRRQIEILDPPESPPDKPKSSKRPRQSAGPSHVTSGSAAADQKSVEE